MTTPTTSTTPTTVNNQSLQGTHTYNDTYMADDDVDNSIDPTTAQQIAKDYECHCFGANVINASPRVVLSFIISLILIAAVIVLIFVVGQVAIFAPILTAIVAFWLPSPLQHSMSRRDATNQAQLMQNNRWMKKAITRYNSNFTPRYHQPGEMTTERHQTADTSAV